MLLCEDASFSTIRWVHRVRSSVARGGRGGSSPLHWLVKYAKSHVFCAFEADFLLKMENSPPPYEKSPPQTFKLAKFWKKNRPEFWRRPFFFFFFWRSPNFWRKKPLNFRSFRDISSQISDKPSKTDSRSMKN